jgi:hypothetical protein
MADHIATTNEDIEAEALSQEWKVLAPNACLWHRIALKSGGSKLNAMAKDGVLLLDEKWIQNVGNLTASEVHFVLYGSR